MKREEYSLNRTYALLSTLSEINSGKAGIVLLKDGGEVPRE